MTDKTYKEELYIPYENKDKAKEYKCFFNPVSKSWFIHSNNEHFDKATNLYSITYLKNIFDNKELYKANGARWSLAYKQWYTYSSNVTLQEYFE
jgi:hypothetical protein